MLDPEHINDLLVAEDIEGFIALGAPQDEYASEAAMITQALSGLGSEQYTQENILAIIAAAWSTFGLAPEELELRIPAMQRVASAILAA